MSINSLRVHGESWKSRVDSCRRLRCFSLRCFLIFRILRYFGSVYSSISSPLLTGSRLKIDTAAEHKTTGDNSCNTSITFANTY